LAGGYAYQVINRGNARSEVFRKSADHEALPAITGEAMIRLPMWVLADCLLPNHFHFARWPRADGELSRLDRGPGGGAWPAKSPGPLLLRMKKRPEQHKKDRSGTGLSGGRRPANTKVGRYDVVQTT
jgi:hypothetical protein